MTLPAGTDYATATFDDVPNSGSETDFSVIVDLSKMPSEWWNAVDTSDGTKGRAAKDSDGTEYATDWIDFDNATNTGLLRIKLTGAVSTGFAVRVYPPEAANSSYAASDTYGSDNAYDSDWDAYFPLHDTNDRTSNGWTLSSGGSLSFGTVAGQLGDATEFNGTTQSAWTNPGTPGNEVTMIAWMNGDDFSATTGKQQIASFADFSGSNRWMGNLFLNDADDKIGIETRNGSPYASYSVGSCSTGTWCQAAGTMDETNNDQYGWKDNAKGTTNTPNAPTRSLLDNLEIGALGRSSTHAQADPFDGKIQHVQLHFTERSDDWIEMEYDQINDNAAFWNIGAGTWTWQGSGTPVNYHNHLIMAF